jgi:hypothetical protein
MWNVDAVEASFVIIPLRLKYKPIHFGFRASQQRSFTKMVKF